MLKSSLEDGRYTVKAEADHQTIGLNAFVSILTWEFEKSYRIANIAGGSVGSGLCQSTVGTSDVPCEKMLSIVCAAWQLSLLTVQHSA